MTDIPVNTGKISLGVGRIIGETFSIFFSRFLSVILLGIVPAFLIVLLQKAIVPDPGGVSLQSGAVAYEKQGFALVLSIVGQSLVTALIIRMAYDAKIGNPMRIGSYFSSVRSSLLWIVICSIIVAFCAMLGTILAAIPGIAIAAFAGVPAATLLSFPAILVALYVFAMWSVVTPAIVIEEAGLSSLGRSFQLTKNYRWPCVGTVFLLFICAFIPIVVIGGLMGYLGTIMSMSIVLFLIEALASGMAMAFFGIGAALIYARLREIKEGTSVEQLAEVFA